MKVWITIVYVHIHVASYLKLSYINDILILVIFASTYVHFSDFAEIYEIHAITHTNFSVNAY